MLLIVTLLAGVAACATPGPERSRDPVGAAIEQPMRDLSLMQDAALPEPLRKAAIAPYGVEGLADCRAIQIELAALDGVLGGDIDAPATAPDGSGQFAAGLIGSVFGLPFRGVVRQVTGAHQRERIREAAVLAGMVRRGFLKGRATLACPVSPPR